MLSLPEVRTPLMAVGMASFVLGVISLLLFFLPVLGIPLAVVGLFFGIVGLVEAFFGVRAFLRWSLFGIAFCSLALLVNVALTFAPWGYIPSRAPPPPWEPLPGRPYVPPPANPVMR